MKRMSTSMMAIAALVLLAALMIVRDAQAEIRVGAALHTPGLRVRIGNAPAGPYGSIRVGHLPVLADMHYRIVKRDRLIAGRLAWYTGVPARELIRLRAYGYLPKAVVRAAFSRKKWNRFACDGRNIAGRGRGRHEKIVVYAH